MTKVNPIKKGWKGQVAEKWTNSSLLWKRASSRHWNLGRQVRPLYCAVLSVGHQNNVSRLRLTLHCKFPHLRSRLLKRVMLALRCAQTCRPYEYMGPSLQMRYFCFGDGMQWVIASIKQFFYEPGFGYISTTIPLVITPLKYWYSWRTFRTATPPLGCAKYHVRFSGLIDLPWLTSYFQHSWEIWKEIELCERRCYAGSILNHRGVSSGIAFSIERYPRTGS